MSRKAQLFELNLNHHGQPGTLVPSRDLERRLDLQLVAHKQEQRSNAAIQFAVYIHAFYLEELLILINQLVLTDETIDLWITTDTEEKCLAIKEMIRKAWAPRQTPQLQVLVVSNRGRNVVPLLETVLPMLGRYGAVLHLHTKRHANEPERGKLWFNDLKQCLMGEQGELHNILKSFSHNPELGVVVPRPAEVIRPYCYWGDNFQIAQGLCESIHCPQKLSWAMPLIFPAGMMFWFRPAALQPLATMLDQLLDLPAEPLPTDGTSLHALERLVLHSCELAGLTWKLCSPAEEWEEVCKLSPSRISVWSEAALEDLNNIAAGTKEFQKHQTKPTGRVKTLMHKLVRRFKQLLNQLAN